MCKNDQINHALNVFISLPWLERKIYPQELRPVYTGGGGKSAVMWRLDVFNGFFSVGDYTLQIGTPGCWQEIPALQSWMLKPAERRVQPLPSMWPVWEPGEEARCYTVLLNRSFGSILASKPASEPGKISQHSVVKTEFQQGFYFSSRTSLFQAILMLKLGF